jgi:hypothetical protein
VLQANYPELHLEAIIKEKNGYLQVNPGFPPARE